MREFNNFGLIAAQVFVTLGGCIALGQDNESLSDNKPVLAIEHTLDAEEIIAEEEAVLELEVAQDAVVIINGKDIGKNHHFIFRGMRRNEIRPVSLECRFSDGGKLKREVLLLAGRRTRLPLRSPSIPIPELVLQQSHQDLYPYDSYTHDVSNVFPSRSIYLNNNNN